MHKGEILPSNNSCFLKKHWDGFMLDKMFIFLRWSYYDVDFGILECSVRIMLDVGLNIGCENIDTTK